MTTDDAISMIAVAACVVALAACVLARLEVTGPADFRECIFPDIG